MHASYSNFMHALVQSRCMLRTVTLCTPWFSLGAFFVQFTQALVQSRVHSLSNNVIHFLSRVHGVPNTCNVIHVLLLVWGASLVN